MEKNNRIQAILERIYGETTAVEACERIARVMAGCSLQRADSPVDIFSERDAVLITYGDTLWKEGELPLQTFRGFAAAYLFDVFSTVHFLPFFPYSSDDGFSVIDYYKVDPALGRWEDIGELQKHFGLMFDFVLNHISARSPWFHGYLESRKGLEDLAIEVDPGADLSGVTRPRFHPLLTRFEKSDGRVVHLWTTFSRDQVDLNYRSLDVLEKMVSVLLFYVSRGARILRLDAIAYLWKALGTSCIHLPEAHDMVRLFRSILDELDPGVVLLTETNVPHAENISYFGNGCDEAQMVYNFTLPPLLLHTFRRKDATDFSQWAAGLSAPSPKTTFFNFTASHDGIGVRPLEGILSAAAIEELVDGVARCGGQVSRKKNPDGSLSPYELNVTYIDALDEGSGLPEKNLAMKFLASQAIQYVLPGVPATYVNSLLGSRNWLAGVAKTGRARSINREKPAIDVVLEDLADPVSFRSRVFFPYRHLIRTRRRQPAFHPNAHFQVLTVHDRVFAMKRVCSTQEIISLVNVSPEVCQISLSRQDARGMMRDLLSGRHCRAESVHLSPYEFLWLVQENAVE